MENINNQDKYKSSLIKLWKQSCDNFKLKIDELNDSNYIRSVINLNTKDDYIIDLIKINFKNPTIVGTISNFHNIAYFFTIQHKYLTISKIIVDIIVDKYYEYEIEENKKVSLFSNKTENINVLKSINLQTTNIYTIDEIINKKSNNFIKVPNCEYVNDNRVKVRIGIPLLSYGNIFIPISFNEYEDLRCYELDSKRRNDMKDVYRNLTLLSPSEYKEFIMWKESKRNYNKDSFIEN